MFVKLYRLMMALGTEICSTLYYYETNKLIVARCNVCMFWQLLF
jgi:hypothetical protein